MSTESFAAYRIHQKDKGVEARFEQICLDDLSDGEVVIRVTHSTINFKDALAATGRGRILRRFPLVGGIDAAGTVHSSDDARFTPGQPVVVNGCGLSETRDGGYARYLRVPAEAVIALPPAIDAHAAMQLGTAGFTAALAVCRMQDNDQQPANGPVVVTGATGGVGSLAVNMLAGLGFEVAAVSGKDSADEYLASIGASQILRRQDIDLGKRPMEKAMWGGAVDNLGGDILTWLTRTVGYGGNIASIGLAASHELNTTVLPFILRGVNLLGINSVDTPRALRERVWERLGGDLKPAALSQVAASTIDFEDLPGAFDDFMTGSVTGRIVVRVSGD